MVTRNIGNLFTEWFCHFVKRPASMTFFLFYLKNIRHHQWDFSSFWEENLPFLLFHTCTQAQKITNFSSSFCFFLIFWQECCLMPDHVTIMCKNKSGVSSLFVCFFHSTYILFLFQVKWYAIICLFVLKIKALHVTIVVCKTCHAYFWYFPCNMILVYTK